jgi:hypothetical protein
MQKYIIEYCPGTKGDLLTGFLNNKITEIEFITSELRCVMDSILYYYVGVKMG